MVPQTIDSMTDYPGTGANPSLAIATTHVRENNMVSTAKHTTKSDKTPPASAAPAAAPEASEEKTALPEGFKGTAISFEIDGFLDIHENMTIHFKYLGTRMKMDGNIPRYRLVGVLLSGVNDGVLAEDTDVKTVFGRGKIVMFDRKAKLIPVSDYKEGSEFFVKVGPKRKIKNTTKSQYMMKVISHDKNELLPKTAAPSGAQEETDDDLPF